MGMFSDFMAGLFDDAPFSTSKPDIFEGGILSDVLPHHGFDAEHEMFLLDHGFGFLVEINPVVIEGDTQDNIANLLSSELPDNVTFQFLNWASPDITEGLQNWADIRMGRSELVDEMVKHRLAKFSDATYGAEVDGGIVPFNRRVFVAVWTEADYGIREVQELKTLREGLRNCFLPPKSVTNFGPTAFLKLMREIFHVAAPEGERFEVQEYAAQLPLNFQLPGSSVEVHSDGLIFSGDPKVSVNCATVNVFPSEFAFRIGLLLQGDPARTMERPRGPVLCSLTIKPLDAQKVEAMILKKRGTMEHGAKTRLGRFTPDLDGKMEEYSNLQNEVRSGERLFQSLYSVAAYGKGETRDAVQATAEISRSYRRHGFKFANDKRLQFPLFIASLPFACSDGYMADFKKLMRMRLLKGAAIAAALPVHGEWRGNTLREGMLLTGRQGQLFQWSNFISSGNYNCAVMGKSGAGKSVLMQEMIVGIYAAGGKVLIIDDGYSFANTAAVLGGRHLTFSGSERIGLNPFGLLAEQAMEQDEYRADALELVARVVTTMADLTDLSVQRVAEVEEEFIRNAISDSWQAHKGAAEIKHVRDRLAEIAQTDERMLDVVKKLERFCPGGQYGNYFEGPPTIALDGDFTVVELSEIKNQRGLEAIVLQLVMFLGTELMYKTDRSVPVAIMIDEAWDLLKGEGTAKFIEGVVRRARKYRGALITGTQSYDDYQSNAGAKVCLENSDYRVYLAQKEDTVDRRPDLSEALKRELKSISSVPGLFSELAIETPEGWVSGRLVVDRFSLAVYSSRGETVVRLAELAKQGLSRRDAILKIISEDRVL